MFTKWLTDWPNMAGPVSGDTGGDRYAGEILAYDHTEALDRIEALYHVRGSRRQFTARVTVVQNNNNGTARITVSVDDAGLGEAWFVESLAIQATGSQRRHTFSVHRWIEPGSPLRLNVA